MHLEVLLVVMIAYVVSVFPEENFDANPRTLALVIPMNQFWSS